MILCEKRYVLECKSQQPTDHADIQTTGKMGKEMNEQRNKQKEEETKKKKSNTHKN